MLRLSTFALLLSLSFAGASLVVPSLSAQGAQSGGNAEGAEPKRKAPPVPCTVIGASLSNGTSLKILSVMLGIRDLRAFAAKTLGRDVSDFELRTRSDAIGLRAILRKIKVGDVSMLDCSDTLFFRNPIQKGPKQLARAARRKGLVLGVDFLFWFGYGGVWGGTPEERASKRLAKQAKGFAMLEAQLLADEGTTLVLGDYPDMTGAVEQMLPKSAIPKPATLAELNRRLYAWVKDKPRVLVYPLARRMADAKKGQLSMRQIGVERKLGTGHLMQLDLLHPTKVGMALITADLLRFLDEKLPDIAPKLPFERSFPAILKAIQESETWAKLDELLGGRARAASRPAKSREASKRPPVRIGK